MTTSQFVDFYELLSIVKEEQRSFTKKDLERLSYDQLLLPAIGNSGNTRCDIEIVLEERRNRRLPYVRCSEEQFDALEKELDEQGCLDDCFKDRLHSSDLPQWDDLTSVTKLFFKLRCLENHVDYPIERIVETLDLIQDCIDEELLPFQLAMAMKADLQSLFLLISKLEDHTIRDVCKKQANHLESFIPPGEIEISQNMTLLDYSCSSRCFSVGG